MGRTVDGYVILEAVGADVLGNSFLASKRDGKEVVWLSSPHRQVESGEGEGLVAALRSLRSLQHPNVLRLLDAGLQSSTEPYLVSELFNGASLDVLLDKNGTILWIPALLIAHEVVSGLSKAHEGGWFHGAIDPRYVLLEGSGQVKLRGIGLKKAWEDSGGDIAMAGDGTEEDVRAVGRLVRSMIYEENKRVDNLPSIVDEIISWEERETPPLLSDALQTLKDATAMAGVKSIEDGLTRFFEQWAFFFLLNRTFSQDSKGEGKGVSPPPSADSFDDSLTESASEKSGGGASPQPGDSGWAEDIGGMFLAVEGDEPLAVDLPESIQSKSFSALENLKAQDRESDDRKRIWLRNGLVGSAIVLVGLLCVLVLQVFMAVPPEEVARKEMLKDFPRFEQDYKALKAERIGPAPVVDEEFGGSVIAPWKSEANALFRAGKVEEARASLRKSASQDLGNRTRHMALANALLPEHALEAEKVLEEYVSRVPKRGPVQVALARVQGLYLEKPQEALDRLEGLFSTYREERAFLELVEEIQRGLNDTSGRIMTLRSILRVQKEPSRTDRLRLAHAYELNGDYLKSETLFKEHLFVDERKESIDNQAFWGFVRANRKRDQVRQLVEVSRGLYSRVPTAADVLVFLTEYSLGRRQYKEAEVSMESLEALDSERWELANAKGILAYRMKKFRKAKGEYLLLGKLRPTDARIRYNLGMTLRKLEEDRMAFQAFDRAFKDDPNLWQARCAMAQDYHLTRDFKNARKAYRDVIGLHPKHPWVSKILEVDLKSKQAEDLMSKPCFHTDIFENTEYVRIPILPPSLPIRFSLEELNVFTPDFRTF